MREQAAGGDHLVAGAELVDHRLLRLPATALRADEEEPDDEENQQDQNEEAAVHVPLRCRQSRHLRSCPASSPAKPATALIAGCVETTPVVSSVKPTLMSRSGAGKAGTSAPW